MTFLEQIHQSLEIVAKVKCKHHKDSRPGEADHCEGRLLQISVYDHYCLALILDDKQSLPIKNIKD